MDPHRALAYWVDAVCDRFLELEIEPTAKGQFSATLDQVELGMTTANFMHAAGQTVRRTRAKISNSDPAMFVLLQLRRGHVRLQQRGTAAHVMPGQCVLINAAEPYDLECPCPTSALALRLPERWLSRWLPHPERYAAHKFEAGGWSGALNSALSCLSPDSIQAFAVPKQAVAEQLAVLLALAVGLESAPTAEFGLIGALRQTLRDRFHEPDLTPASVATSHQISKRRLHYAFAEAQTAFSTCLLEMRLQHGRELLSDPRHATLSVAEVAARCGFLDQSHFARRFRHHFGQTPLNFRARAIGRKH